MGNVATKTCKACRSEIDRKATRCPNCRADQRSWAARHKIITIFGGGLLFFGVMGAIGGSGGASSAPPDATSVPQATEGPAATDVPSATDVPTAVPTAVPVLSVSGVTLARQFDANKVTALRYYKDRTIQTSGVATNVSQDMLGSYYVALKPADDSYSGFTSMQCYVSGADAVASVVNGQPVTVRGRIDDQTLGIIAIKDCSVL